MTNKNVTLRTPGGTLIVGQIPRVVGTLSSLPENCPVTNQEVPCDIVEVRLDEALPEGAWLDRCQRIEANGLPVLLTIRLKSEGGKWANADDERFDLFEPALNNLSAVDVEFSSPLLSRVSDLAKRLGKTCIVSFHDFKQTPSLENLRSIVLDAQRSASIVKISTMVKTAQDETILRDLLLEKWDVPICVIGMGASGTHTRVTFSTLGSCMTYGYLDKPSAPGQLPASNLVDKLRSLLPKYNEDFVIRKQILEYA
jgi:3-dehydroquinate dehydratase-1